MLLSVFVLNNLNGNGNNSSEPKQIFIFDIFESIDFEKIVDHPNILIAAHFWDTERYQAARNCYKFMRTIDDLIDNYKTEHITISPENQAQFRSRCLSQWIGTVIEASIRNSLVTVS